MRYFGSDPAASLSIGRLITRLKSCLMSRPWHCLIGYKSRIIAYQHSRDICSGEQQSCVSKGRQPIILTLQKTSQSNDLFPWWQTAQCAFYTRQHAWTHSFRVSILMTLLKVTAFNHSLSPYPPYLLGYVNNKHGEKTFLNFAISPQFKRGWVIDIFLATE